MYLVLLPLLFQAAGAPLSQPVLTPLHRNWEQWTKRDDSVWYNAVGTWRDADDKIVGSRSGEWASFLFAPLGTNDLRAEVELVGEESLAGVTVNSLGPLQFQTILISSAGVVEYQVNDRGKLERPRLLKSNLFDGGRRSVQISVIRDKETLQIFVDDLPLLDVPRQDNTYVGLVVVAGEASFDARYSPEPIASPTTTAVDKR